MLHQSPTSHNSHNIPSTTPHDPRCRLKEPSKPSFRMSKIGQPGHQHQCVSAVRTTQKIGEWKQAPSHYCKNTREGRTLAHWHQCVSTKQPPSTNCEKCAMHRQKCEKSIIHLSQQTGPAHHQDHYLPSSQCNPPYACLSLLLHCPTPQLDYKK